MTNKVVNDDISGWKKAHHFEIMTSYEVFNNYT